MPYLPTSTRRVPERVAGTSAVRPAPGPGHSPLPPEHEALTGLDAAIDAGVRAAAPAAALAFALAGGELGDLPELPLVVGADAVRLRAVAPLYLAAEVEAAELVRGAEVLAGLWVGGGLTADLGPAAPRLMDVWRGRHERFTVEERQAVYARMFGEPNGPLLAVRGARNLAFEGLLIDVADALFSVADLPAGRRSASASAALQVSLQALGDNLLTRAGGVPDQAAAELVDGVRIALELFREPALQRAVGAASVWEAVRAVARRYLGTAPEVAVRVERATCGSAVLGWVGTALAAPGAAVTASVSSAAGRWLEASLRLRESEEAGRAPAR